MLTMLVPIKKWLESVGRNFKWSVCNVPVFTASRGDLRARQARRGRKIPNRKVKGYNIPSQKQTVQHRNMPLHHIHSAHRHVPIILWGDTNNNPQHITNKIVWPRQSSCVPLSKDIVGYFEAGSDGLSSQAVHQSHLSAARRAELCSNFTLPPGLSPVGENERQDEAGATCEKTDCVCGKRGGCSKTWRPYLDLLESLPRWPLGVPLPPKGHREEDMSSPSWHKFAVCVEC